MQVGKKLRFSTEPYRNTFYALGVAKIRGQEIESHSNGAVWCSAEYRCPGYGKTVE